MPSHTEVCPVTQKYKLQAPQGVPESLQSHIGGNNPVITELNCQLSYCADKDKRPDIPRGPSGRPDDPHMQVDTTADDHPAPKAG